MNYIFIMVTNLSLLQQFFTLFNSILAKWHSFANSAVWMVWWKEIKKDLERELDNYQIWPKNISQFRYRYINLNKKNVKAIVNRWSTLLLFDDIILVEFQLLFSQFHSSEPSSQSSRPSHLQFLLVHWPDVHLNSCSPHASSFPQFASSFSSTQSVYPSHTHEAVIQLWSHWNSSLPQ